MHLNSTRNFTLFLGIPFNALVLFSYLSALEVMSCLPTFWLYWLIYNLRVHIRNTLPVNITCLYIVALILKSTQSKSNETCNHTLFSMLHLKFFIFPGTFFLDIIILWSYLAVIDRFSHKCKTTGKFAVFCDIVMGSLMEEVNQTVQNFTLSSIQRVQSVIKFFLNVIFNKKRT
jgi:hypothetical protein